MAGPQTPYHKQTDGEFCGAACLQMVIGALNHAAGSQTTLFNAAHKFPTVDPASQWASPPDGVEFVLEDKGQLNAADVKVLQVGTEIGLTRQAIWSLQHHGVPPIVLVWGWAHWVVVVEFETSDGTPQGLDDDGYEIKSLGLHDPALEPDEDEPPPPRYVSYSKWSRDYLMPVPAGFWAGKRVAVGVFVP